MAELLVKAIDAVHPDPDKDRLCYKRGDVVAVMPDGHEWGKEEGPPKFCVVKLPGKAVDGLRQQYMSMNKNAEGKALDRREKRLALDKLAAGTRRKLDDTGAALLTVTEIEGITLDKTKTVKTVLKPKAL